MMNEILVETECPYISLIDIHCIFRNSVIVTLFGFSSFEEMALAEVMCLGQTALINGKADATNAIPFFSHIVWRISNNYPLYNCQ